MAQAASAEPLQRPRRVDLFGVHSGRFAYWLVLPLIALEAVFVFYPIARGVLVSVEGPEGFDLSNYRGMLTDPDFFWIMVRTLVFTVLIDVIVLVVGLGVALLTN
jgi:ABC-type sugar transport system permease subunit